MAFEVELISCLNLSVSMGVDPMHESPEVCIIGWLSKSRSNIIQSLFVTLLTFGTGASA
jgi:hypothetical protein